MSTYDGKNCVVSFAIVDEATTPSSYTTLGMMKTKSLKIAWASKETTADSTEDSATTMMATRKTITFSGTGVAYDDTAYNQRTLKTQVNHPGSGTQYQPKAWFKLEFPSGESYVGPFIITGMSSDSPEADVGTWSLDATSNGDVTYTAS